MIFKVRAFIFFAANILSLCAYSYTCNRIGHGNVYGCPFDKESATGHGQASFHNLPQKVEKSLLDRYNSAYPVCDVRANKAVAVYSKYSDGLIYFLDGKIVLEATQFDRVLLKDLIDGKAILKPSGRPLCKITSSRDLACSTSQDSCVTPEKAEEAASAASQEVQH